MEKVTSKEIKSILNTHNFYCDMCKKHLGSTEEYDDGYYATIGDYDLKFNVNSEWYSLHYNLCVECRAKKETRNYRYFIIYGFCKGVTLIAI